MKYHINTFRLKKWQHLRIYFHGNMSHTTCKLIHNADSTWDDETQLQLTLMADFHLKENKGKKSEFDFFLFSSFENDCTADEDFGSYRLLPFKLYKKKSRVCDRLPRALWLVTVTWKKIRSLLTFIPSWSSNSLEGTQFSAFEILHIMKRLFPQCVSYTTVCTVYTVL